MRIRIAALTLTATFATVTASLAAADQAPVTVFMYSEYIDPAVPAEFEKATGFPLKIEVYEAQEEMLAKLRAGATNQYDVVVATDVVVTQLIKLKLVQPLDNSRIPNSTGVDGKFVNPGFDPKNAYSWPYQWGTIGLLYDTSKAPKGEASWKWLFDESSQFGSFVFMDEQRSMLGVANKYLGFAMNTRDANELKRTADTLIKAKGTKNCLGFDGGVGGKNKVLAGQAAAAVVYNGDAIRAIDESKERPLAYVVPKEGSNIWVDTMLISKDAPNVAGAHAFINYVLSPEVAAKISNFNRYATPVAAAMPLITPDDAKNPAIYPDEATVKTLDYLEDLGKDTRMYNEAWTAVKSR